MCRRHHRPPVEVTAGVVSSCRSGTISFRRVRIVGFFGQRSRRLANIKLASYRVGDQACTVFTDERCALVRPARRTDQFLLGAKVTLDAPVGVIEKADDGGLFRERWKWQQRGFDCVVREAIPRHPISPYVKLVRNHRTLYSSEQETAGNGAAKWPKQCQVVATDRVVW